MNLLATITRDAIDPALALLPGRMDNDRARVQLLATGLQESRLIHRDQLESPGGRDLVDGPAMGVLQFERGGGVSGVLRHPATAKLALEVCSALGVEPTQQAVWKAMETNDILAMAFGRLLLWTDAKPLPAIGDDQGAWTYYLRNWRPGKPHPQTWPGFYRQAVEFVTKGTL